MRIILLMCLLLVSLPVRAADQPIKVYSAQELQKIADSVYQSLNNRDVKAADVELIQNQLNQQPNHSDTLKQLEKAFAANKTDNLRHIYSAVNAVSTDVKTKEPTAQDDISANNPAPQVSIEKPEPARRPSQRLDIWLERQNAANSEARIVPQSAKTMQ